MNAGPGRPSQLTPEVHKGICTAIRTTKIPLSDAARSLGLSSATVSDWVKRGKHELAAREDTIYARFARDVAKARAEGTKMLMARIAKAGVQSKHWQANVALISMTEPHLAPRVRTVVDKELCAAIDRITTRFSDRPDLLEEILKTIADGADAEGEEGEA